MPYPRTTVPTERLAQLLVQATAALRNLTGAEGGRQLAVKSRSIEAVLQIMTGVATGGGNNDESVWTVSSSTPALGALGQFGELMLNCVRILAKLSLYEDCRRLMAGDRRAVAAIFELLTIHGRSQPLVVRVCFVLGNLTSRAEPLRLLLAGPDNHGIDTLLGLLFDYSLVDEALFEQQPDAADGYLAVFLFLFFFFTCLVWLVLVYWFLCCFRIFVCLFRFFLFL
jgi:hypothetical protein